MVFNVLNLDHSDTQSAPTELPKNDFRAKVSKTLPEQFPEPYLIDLMRCAKGIFAKGMWECTGFSLLRWEKGSEAPSCDGEKGLSLPRSSCSDLGNKGGSDPFPTKRGSLRPFFPPQRENPVHPQIPLAKIPLAQRMMIAETMKSGR